MEGVTDGPCMRGSKVPEKCVNRGETSFCSYYANGTDAPCYARGKIFYMNGVVY